ncbi:hypothetical protein G7Z17_g6923 [Cylindrodendrum hubeiense]|uniref:Heterokaryon incompatibility domain-containing protein n=1 Tax=Cylindrodendrum hubeiense TaxID=595255 RepID=A0A9P5HCD0_9HYPO|nr:hypothetical protein G7Z17_g6923 [Cylindrodendrum hubeiense]
MAADEFSYQPIDNSSLRILELFPGDAAEPLRGKLHVCNEHPWKLAYECISYAWGCSDFTHSIAVNGKTLPITANLHAALHDFRLPQRKTRSGGTSYIGAMRCAQRNRRLSNGKGQDLQSIPTSGSRFIWADGICINQRDNREKACQVIRMAAYYKAALRVLIHLGLEFKGGGHLLLDLLKRTNRYMRRKAREAREEKRALAKNPRHRLRPISPTTRELPARDDRVWDPLRAVFDSSYWSRFWVIQEVVEARTAFLYYGQGFVTLDEFCSTFGWLIPCQLVKLSLEPRQVLARYPNAIAFNRLVRFREGIDKVGRSWGLIDLIESCRLSNASDPRDYIYGLLGLAPEAYGLRENGGSFEMTSGSVDLSHELLDASLDDEAPVLRVDYEESVTACYLRFARYMICWGDGLKLLYAASSGHRSDGPSWVPDWSTSSMTPVRLAPQRHDCTPCTQCTASTTETYIRLGDVPGHLIVRGVILDRISQVGQKAVVTRAGKKRDQYEFLPSQLGELTPALRELTGFLGDMSKSYGEFSPEEAIWRTLCYGKGAGAPGQEPETPLTEMMTATCRLFDLLQSISDGEALSPSSKAEIQHWQGGKPRHAMEWFLDSTRDITQRRPGVTDDGWIGMLPPGAEIDDWVFVPLGSAVPFVIRRDGEMWKLVGECYIQGVMQGELFEALKAPRDVDRARHGQSQAGVFKSYPRDIAVGWL